MYKKCISRISTFHVYTYLHSVINITTHPWLLSASFHCKPIHIFTKVGKNNEIFSLKKIYRLTFVITGKRRKYYQIKMKKKKKCKVLCKTTLYIFKKKKKLQNFNS